MEGQTKHDIQPALMQEYNCNKCKDKGFVYVRSWDSPATFGGFGMVDVVPEDCDHCQPEPDDGQPSWEQEWQDFGEVYDDEPSYI